MEAPPHIPRSPLLTIYKSSNRLHLNYGDLIYDQAYNTSFHQKLDSIQYNAALAKRGAIRGTFKEKLMRCLIWYQSLFSVCMEV